MHAHTVGLVTACVAMLPYDSYFVSFFTFFQSECDHERSFFNTMEAGLWCHSGFSIITKLLNICLQPLEITWRFRVEYRQDAGDIQLLCPYPQIQEWLSSTVVWQPNDHRIK